MSTNTANSPSTDSPVGSPPGSAESAIQCIGCGTVAAASRRFCGNCGEQLWDPCLHCEEKNPVDVKFCGSCGNPCDRLVTATLQELTQGIAAADRLAETGRYLDAAAQLSSLKTAEHSQLRELNEQIQERIKRFSSDRDQAIDRLKQVMDTVEPLIQECNYEAAHQELMSVPPAFRNQEHGELLQDVESKLSESKRLRETVKRALEKQDYDSLYDSVPLLSELDPNDKELQKLLGQLEQRQTKLERQDATRLLKVAKAALAKCDYTQARTALEKIPAASKENAELAKVISAIQERVWLAEQLRRSPIATPALRVVSQRLAKLQPHDKQHAKLHLELKSRLQKATNDNSGKVVPWSRASKNSVLDLPVTMLDLPAALASAKTSHGQSLVIAYGLALQGLGQAQISLNLAPQEKKSKWLKRLSLKSGKNKSPATAWGIDIGCKYLKAVQLQINDASQQVEVLESVIMRHKQNDGGASELAAAKSETINKFLKEHSLADQVVVLNIDGTQTLGRFFDLPAPKPEKFFEAVAYEVRARIPLDEQRLCFDYHWSTLPSEHDAETADAAIEQRRVVLVAAERQILQQRLSSFAEAGAAQLLVQSDCIALYNVLCHTQQHTPADSIAVVEIGSQTSDFVVLSGSTCWFRGLYQGTNSFDKALASGLKATVRDAERMRLQPEKVRALHEIDELLQPEFANLTKELHRTLRRYQEETGNTVSQLYLCGAGSQQLGLLTHLYSE